MCRYLIERGASVNRRDRAGMTPLHWSVDQKSQAAIDVRQRSARRVRSAERRAISLRAQVLLANNADASLGDNDGRTPLASMKEPDWHKRKADRERRQVCVAGASLDRAFANPTRRRSVWAS